MKDMALAGSRNRMISACCMVSTYSNLQRRSGTLILIQLNILPCVLKKENYQHDDHADTETHFRQTSDPHADACDDGCCCY